jgi:Photosynthesis system II assembly factor YCF48
MDLKRLLSERLNFEPAGPHPDPELLAALAENSVSRSDRDHLLEHLAACTGCRELLYLALPVEDAQPVFSIRKQPRFALRWATLAASLIIVAGVVITNRSMLTEHYRLMTSASPAAAVSNQITPRETPSASNPAAQTAAAATPVKVRPQEKHMTAKPQASLEFDQSGEVHFAAGPAAKLTAEPASEHSQSNPPDRLGIRWSISPRGGVERSLDSGRTWQTLAVGNGATFQAISSVGANIWVGGAAGALYHSSNSGQTWTKVEPAFAYKRLESDVSNVEFSDARNGLVSTANGEVWTTSDGGQSWQLK